LKKRANELTRLINEAVKTGDRASREAYSAEKMEVNRELNNLRKESFGLGG
jgi:hypothetical protein